MAKIPHDPDELVAVVDGNDKVIGTSTRGEVHKKGILHREVAIYLINPVSKQVLLQKRLDNHKWDHSSAGHFPFNQNYEQAAKREFQEELGISLPLREFKELTYKEIRKKLTPEILNYRFIKVFLVEKDISLEKFNFDRDEIEEIKYFDKKDLLDLLKHSQDLTSSAVEIIRDYILNRI